MTATVPVPVKGGTVGFADGRVAFCTACGWRGIATYPAHPRLRRRLRSRHYGHEHALTFCPACQREPDTRIRERRPAPSKPKRKAARAARRRNR